MKTSRILATSITTLLALSFAANAQTWDGGGVNDNLNTSNNWNPDGTPSTVADVIFAGNVRLTPNVSAAFQVNSLTFNNTAGAFVFGGVGTLSIKAGGLVNNDADLQTFNNAVSFGLAATSTINAASGALALNGAVTLPTSTLTLDGANAITFGSTISGTGAITKIGAGAFNFNATATSIGEDFNLNAGATNLVATGTTQTFTGSSAIAVNGTASLAFNESAILDGALLTRASTATVTLAAGKTLTIQNGGDFTITGNQTFATASAINVTGIGSTLTTTSALSLNGGITANVLAGGTISAAAGSVAIGTSGNGTVTVDGSGSSFGGGTSSIGSNGGTGNLTFSNASTGAFTGTIFVDNSGAVATSGTLTVQSGATVTGTGLSMGFGNVANTGTVTINGAGSALTLTGAATTTLGTASASTNTLNVQNGGTFTSGTGVTTVNATGTVAITGGTFNQNGDMTLNGGKLTRDAAGSFKLAAGKTLTVQGGGLASFNGSYFQNTAATFNVTGAGSTFSAPGGPTFGGGSTLNITGGGRVLSIGGFINLGTDSGNATVLVDGAGSTLNTNSFSSITSAWGSFGSTAIVTFSNGSSGSILGGILLTNGTAGSAGTINVQTGSTLTVGDLLLGTSVGTATATLTVDGFGSLVTQNGSASLTVGASSGSVATLNVQNSGVFASGTGPITVNKTGTILVNSPVSGAFFAKGDLTLNSGGQFVINGFDAFNLAAGKTMTIQGGSDMTITGAQGFLTAATINVTGGGSTLTTAGQLIFGGGSTANVLGGGTVSSGTGNLFIGSSGPASAVTVDGSGSSLSGGQLNLGAASTGSLSLSNGGTGAFDSIFMGVNSGAASTLLIQSGASVTGGGLALSGNAGISASAIVTINGVGSALTIGGGGGTSLGSSSVSIATITVQNGGVFTSDFLAFNATGVLNLDGGTVTITGPVTYNGGTVNFNSGALLLTSPATNLSVGTGGMLGTNLTLTSAQRLAIGGTTTVDAFRSLTLNGGNFSTGALVNNGTISFNSGTLAITGAGGFNIGTGALGANVTLGAGANLQVTNTAAVAAGATLTLNGGAFTAGTLNNTGTLRANLGTASVATLTNNGGGRIFVGDTLTASGAWTNAAGTQLTLENSGLVNGAGAITNSGLVTGDGTIANAFTNASGGEVRGEFGKTLSFTGTAGANAGRVNLLGGTLQFTQQFTNSATGQINGQGNIYFPTTPVPSSASPTAGFMNAGNLNFTGGDSQIYGTVQMQPGSRLIVSGGATASFFDVFRHSGAEVRTSAGSNTVFFGEVRGTGSFTGTGTTYFEGGYSPGNSPALITHGGNVVFGTFNTVIMEIGGTVRGTQYDALDVAGKLTFDGALNVPLINAFVPQPGNAFNLFDWGTTAGTFTSVSVPALNPGIEWDQSTLYIDGTLRIGLDTAFVSRTWDGGGANNNWITDANWTLDVQPLNNATADLIFAGLVRLAPSVDTAWNVHSITFNNTAGAFTITGPQGVTIGTGGIVNNDTQTQTITAAITLSANESFNAAAGDLSISSVALAGHTLALAGANDITLASASATGPIEKNNAGRLDITGALGTGGVVLDANTGTTNIGASQTLAALNIGGGATVTLGAIPPSPAPEFGDGGEQIGASALPVPEPGPALLTLLGSALLGLHPRRGRNRLATISLN